MFLAIAWFSAAAAASWSTATSRLGRPTQVDDGENIGKIRRSNSPTRLEETWRRSGSRWRCPREPSSRARRRCDWPGAFRVERRTASKVSRWAALSARLGERQRVLGGYWDWAGKAGGREVCGRCCQLPPYSEKRSEALSRSQWSSGRWS